MRAEVERNTRIESGLQEMDDLREATKKARADLATAQKDLDDKMKLLTAARRSIGEYRDKIRVRQGPCLEDCSAHIVMMGTSKQSDFWNKNLLKIIILINLNSQCLLTHFIRI